MRTPLPSPKGGRDPSQFSAHFYCGQTAACIKMPLGMDVCVSPGDSVLDGDSAPPPSQKGRRPQFSAHVYCGQTAAWIKMSLATEVGLGPDHTVLDGDAALTSPTPPRQFSAHFYCGQMAECIKMPLGMEVTFPESRFLEKTFRGKTFPGMSLSRKVVSRKRRFPERGERMEGKGDPTRTNIPGYTALYPHT